MGFHIDNYLLDSIYAEIHYDVSCRAGTYLRLYTVTLLYYHDDRMKLFTISLLTSYPIPQ